MSYIVVLPTARCAAGAVLVLSMDTSEPADAYGCSAPLAADGRLRRQRSFPAAMAAAFAPCAGGGDARRKLGSARLGGKVGHRDGHGGVEMESGGHAPGPCCLARRRRGIREGAVDAGRREGDEPEPVLVEEAVRGRGLRVELRRGRRCRGARLPPAVFLRAVRSPASCWACASGHAPSASFASSLWVNRTEIYRRGMSFGNRKCNVIQQ